MRVLAIVLVIALLISQYSIVFKIRRKKYLNVRKKIKFRIPRYLAPSNLKYLINISSRETIL